MPSRAEIQKALDTVRCIIEGKGPAAKKKKKKKSVKKKKKSAKKSAKKKVVRRGAAFTKTGKLKPGYAKVAGRYVKKPKGLSVTAHGNVKVSSAFSTKLSKMARVGVPGAAVLRKHIVVPL